MAGNSFNLCDRYFHFDLIPHFHGTGAAGMLMQTVLLMPALRAIAAANILHVLLEAQAYLTDVLVGTHNVRGTWDAVGDLVSGLAGTLVNCPLYLYLRSRTVVPSAKR